jgi:hypothetical protein
MATPAFPPPVAATRTRPPTPPEFSLIRDQAEIAVECLKGIQAYLGEIAAGMRDRANNAGQGGIGLTGGGGRGNALVMLRLASPAEAVDVLRMAVDEWDRDMGARLGLSDIHRHKSKAAVLALLAHTSWRHPDEMQTAGAMDWVNAMILAGGAGARKTAKNKLSQASQFAEFLKVERPRHVRELANPLAGIKLPKASRGRANAGAKPFTWDQCDALEALAREAGARDRERPEVRAAAAHVLQNAPVHRAAVLRGGAPALGRHRPRSRRDDGDERQGGPERSDPADGRAGRDAGRVAGAAPGAELPARQRKKAGFLFPAMPSHHTLTGDMEAAGIPGLADGKRGQWHRFRKAIGTRACGQGVDIRIAQKMLRHADIAVTARDYTDLEMAVRCGGGPVDQNSGCSLLRPGGKGRRCGC